MASLDPHDLEAALPALIERLRELQQTLSPEERGVFEEIIRSASLYTVQTQGARARGAVYAKPISATATQNMKDQIANLPSTLNIPDLFGPHGPPGR